MIYGYARISTVNKKQKLDRQFHELLSHVDDLQAENIFTDKMSGLKKDRPGLTALKEKLKPGDIVYVESLSRLSRSTQDLLEQIKEFSDKEVEFHSLKEDFDFNTVYGKLILTVLAAVNSLERDIIAERVREGVAVARLKGRRIGRPPIDSKRISEALKLHKSGDYSVSSILSMTGISRSTFYKALNKQKLEEKAKQAEHAEPIEQAWRVE